MQHIAMIAAATMTMPIKVNTPATFPVFEKKPFDVTIRCTDSTGAGGAVGVIVIVVTLPVMVITATDGVGVQDVSDVDELSSVDKATVAGIIAAIVD